MKQVTVKVPGTTANLGPGYDCLGVALNLYNEITLSCSDTPTTHPMMAEAAALFFQKTGKESFAFDWKITGDVPRSRGLGSSVTLRLGVLHGLNSLTGSPLDRQTLFELCSTLEGHPDNAAPAEFGGFTTSRHTNQFCRIPVEKTLHFVLLIPEFEVLTSAARRVLPATIDHGEAVRNTANTAMITAAFATGDYQLLRGSFHDFLHQSYRTPLIPQLPHVINAGIAAGALGGYLSGSGSTIACITLDSPDQVAGAMLAALAPEPARCIVTKVDNHGTVIQSNS